MIMSKMVAESFPKCNDPTCDADEVNDKADEGNTCAIAKKCVAACAAYGRVCPCFARAAGRAAHEALVKLTANSALFEAKPGFVTFDTADLIIKEKLGEGGFSNVNACVLKSGSEAGEELAVKYLKRQVMVDKHSFEHGATDLAIEARFLAALSNEHIIKLHGVTAGSVETNLASGKECGFFIIVDRLYDTLDHRIAAWHEESEAMTGNLLSRFSTEHKEKKKRALLERVKLAFEIAETMDYLHGKRIIYRDLKPDNVGFDKNGTLKLFDFGLARELKPSEGRPDGRYQMTGNTGSRRYMAPEVAKESPYDQSVDVYSFGILLWEMCAAEKPFFGYSSGKHMKHVVLGGERPKMDTAHTNHWPLHLQWLMNRCWSAFPSQRPTFEMVKQTLLEVMTTLEGPGSEKKLTDLKPPVGGFGSMKMAPRAARAQTHSHASSPSTPPTSAKGFAAFQKPTRTRGQTTSDVVNTKAGDNQELEEKGSSPWRLRRPRADSIDA